MNGLVFKQIPISLPRSNSLTEVVIDGTSVLLVNLNGEYHALDNFCTHMRGKLSNGRLKGDQVMCPRHYASFNVKTGKYISGPGSGNSIKKYTLKIEGEKIFISI